MSMLPYFAFLITSGIFIGVLSLGVVIGMGFRWIMQQPHVEVLFFVLVVSACFGNVMGIFVGAFVWRKYRQDRINEKIDTAFKMLKEIVLNPRVSIELSKDLSEISHTTSQAQQAIDQLKLLVDKLSYLEDILVISGSKKKELLKDLGILKGLCNNDLFGRSI